MREVKLVVIGLKNNYKAINYITEYRLKLQKDIEIRETVTKEGRYYVPRVC